MERAKCSLASLAVGLSLIFAPPTHAQRADLSGSRMGNDASSAVSKAGSGHRFSNVMFDGRNLSLRVAKDIAADPLIAWGTVRNANGEEIQGEVWLLIAKNDKFVDFHLTEKPGSSDASIAYGGYTVKIKAIMTAQGYYFGYGGAVPIIGNETDAFVVTTTKTMVNSAFTEGEPQQRSLSTGQASDYLVYVYDAVQSYSQPRALSASRRAAIQFFAPDGTELTEPFSQHSVASSSSSSSSDCEAVGNDAASAVNRLMSGAQTASWYATLPGKTVMGGMAGSTGGVLGGPAGAYALSGAVGVAMATRQTVLDAVGTLSKHVGAAVFSGLAEGLCNNLSAPEVLPPIQLDSVGVEDVVFMDVVMVCVLYKNEATGSTSTVDEESGDVEVTGHSEQVCAEWDYRVVPNKD